MVRPTTLRLLTNLFTSSLSSAAVIPSLLCDAHHGVHELHKRPKERRCRVTTCGEPGGRYEFRGVILEGSGVEGGFDRDSVHNPFAIWHKGRFYLYYSGNHGDGTYAVHTANQHVGLASAADPLGKWTRSDTPLFAPRLGAFDESGTTNPSVCRAPDGRFVMVYKCWSKEPPFNDRVSIGAAFADRPEGPWRRLDSPIFDAPGV